MALPPIKLKVSDSKEIVFEGEVNRISSFNEMGPFDVYSMHANFISIIQKQVDLYQNHKKIKEIPLEKAILKVKQDQAHIFLGIDTLMMEEDTDDTSPKTNKESPVTENKK